MQIPTKYQLNTKYGISTYRILLRLQKQDFAKQIAKDLNMPYTTVINRIKTLTREGFIKPKVRSNIKIYQITSEGRELMKVIGKPINTTFSYPMKNHTRTHNLCLYIPILVDNPEKKWHKEGVKFGTWKGNVDTLKDLTIVKSSKAVRIYIHNFETEKKPEFLSEQLSIMWRNGIKAILHLENQGISVDFNKAKVINQEFALEIKEKDGVFDKSQKTLVELGRMATSIVETELTAKKWLDHSKGTPEIETNDLIAEEKELLQAENVYEIKKKMDLLEGFTSKISITQMKMHENMVKQTESINKFLDSEEKIIKGLYEKNEKPKTTLKDFNPDYIG